MRNTKIKIAFFASLTRQVMQHAIPKSKAVSSLVYSLTPYYYNSRDKQMQLVPCRCQSPQQIQ